MSHVLYNVLQYICTLIVITSAVLSVTVNHALAEQVQYPYITCGNIACSCNVRQHQSERQAMQHARIDGQTHYFGVWDDKNNAYFLRSKWDVEGAHVHDNSRLETSMCASTKAFDFSIADAVLNMVGYCFFTGRCK